KQTCPQLDQTDTAERAAASRSASANTMLGVLPPSSSVTGLRSVAVRRWMSWPTAVDPVKVILWTPGCSTMAIPVSPAPGTTLTTPGGTPASSISSASQRVDSGASSDGLSTTTL